MVTALHAALGLYSLYSGEEYTTFSMPCVCQGLPAATGRL